MPQLNPAIPTLVRLINKRKLKSYVEVGVFKGVTARFIWRKCPWLEKIWLVDPWSADVINREIDGVIYSDSRPRRKGNPIQQSELDLYYESIRREAPPNVQIIRDTSVEASKLFEDNSVDLVFIDASHFYEDVLEDIDAWLPKVSTRGFLTGDDYTELFPGLMRAVDESFDLNGVIGDRIWIIEKSKAKVSHTRKVFKLKWYKGNSTNFHPTRAFMQEPDAIDKYILSGWLPESPFIDKDTKLISFGSCFARELTGRLAAYGVRPFKIKSQKIPIVFAAAEFDTTFTICQQLEWVFRDRKFDEDLWWTRDKQLVVPSEEDKLVTKEAVKEADVFVFTLGLSEVWYNEVTGDVFWRAIPDHQFDDNVHKFKVSTVSENVENLNKIWSIIKEHNPQAKIILTLSPVPLAATFRPISCVTANNVSKSILRVAIDEFVRSHESNLNKDLFYWPSYEIVKEYFKEDQYRRDNRHVRDNIIDVVVSKFFDYFVSKDRL